jgi:hypothetical protein
MITQNPGCSSCASNIPEKEDCMRIRDDFTVFPREMASRLVAPDNDRAEPKQREINSTPEFEGL